VRLLVDAQKILGDMQDRKKGLFCEMYMCDYVINVAQALRCWTDSGSICFMTLESEKEHYEDRYPTRII
jgi:hypothetical protein